MKKIFSWLLFALAFGTVVFLQEILYKKPINISNSSTQKNEEVKIQNKVGEDNINIGKYYFGNHIECTNGNMVCLEKSELNKFCMKSKLGKSGKEIAVRADKEFSGNLYALYHLAEFGEIDNIKINYTNDKTIQCVVNFNISGIYKGTSYSHSIKSCANEFAVKTDGEILITDATSCSN
jgi:hypothetical protein